MGPITIEHLIEKHGLGQMSDAILSVCTPCVAGSTVAGPVSMGASKVGGCPHVEEGFVWPFFKGGPLEFVAQINCSDFRFSGFPSQGLLLFFYDNYHGGYSINDKGFIKIEYIKNIDRLSICEPPTIVKKRLGGLFGSYTLPKIYKEARLELTEAVSLPDLERTALHLEDEAHEESYWEIKEGLVGDRFIQIGGYPNPVQTDDMEQFVSKLLNRGGPQDWIMILEISDDAKTDMMWGDAGRIHFFVHKEDLDSLDFSRPWLQMQCF